MCVHNECPWLYFGTLISVQTRVTIWFDSKSCQLKFGWGYREVEKFIDRISNFSAFCGQFSPRWGFRGTPVPRTIYLVRSCYSRPQQQQQHSHFHSAKTWCPASHPLHFVNPLLCSDMLSFYTEALLPLKCPLEGCVSQQSFWMHYGNTVKWKHNAISWAIHWDLYMYR